MQFWNRLSLVPLALAEPSEALLFRGSELRSKWSELSTWSLQERVLLFVAALAAVAGMEILDEALERLHRRMFSVAEHFLKKLKEVREMK